MLCYIVSITAQLAMLSKGHLKPPCIPLASRMSHEEEVRSPLDHLLLRSRSLFCRSSRLLPPLAVAADPAAALPGTEVARARSSPPASAGPESPDPEEALWWVAGEGEGEKMLGMPEPEPPLLRVAWVWA
jgi:hypothetical protein